MNWKTLLALALLAFSACTKKSAPPPPPPVVQPPEQAAAEQKLRAEQGARLRKIKGNLPKCIEASIQKLMIEPRKNPPVTVNAYQYGVQDAFSIGEDCCDNVEVLLDRSCKVLCSPKGSLAGKTPGNCKDKLELIGEVWRDYRPEPGGGI